MRPTRSSGPKLTKLLRQYPDIKVEIIIDYGLTDIVAERFDAGVRSGEQVAKDMIAVRIGPDMRSAVVGAPSYFNTRSEPKRPQELIGHNCINLRLPTRGGLYAWEFEKDGRELKVHIEGQLVFNGTFQMLNAALAGFGLAPMCRRTWRNPHRQGPSETGARGLVPSVFGLSPLLPESPPIHAGLRLIGRGASLPWPWISLTGDLTPQRTFPARSAIAPAGRPALAGRSGDRGDDLDVQFIANLASPPMVTTIGSLSASTSNAGRFFGPGPRGLPDWPFLESAVHQRLAAADLLIALVLGHRGAPAILFTRHIAQMTGDVVAGESDRFVSLDEVCRTREA
jgi:hypothetical protein